MPERQAIKPISTHKPCLLHRVSYLPRMCTSTAKLQNSNELLTTAQVFDGIYNMRALWKQGINRWFSNDVKLLHNNYLEPNAYIGVVLIRGGNEQGPGASSYIQRHYTPNCQIY